MRVIWESLELGDHKTSLMVLVGPSAEKHLYDDWVLTSCQWEYIMTGGILGRFTSILVWEEIGGYTSKNLEAQGIRKYALLGRFTMSCWIA